MSGFEQLASQLAGLGKLQARMRAVGDVTTEAGHVRLLLVDGPKSSEQMQRLSGLTAKQIWGRLKHDIQQGRVKRSDAGEFYLVEVDQEAIDAAVALLRRSGYTVTRNKARARND